MTPELILAALIKMMPEGKTTIPMNLVVNKSGSSLVIDIKIIIQDTKEERPIVDT